METKIKILQVMKWIYFITISIFIFGFWFIIQYKWSLYVMVGFLVVVLVLYFTIHLLRSKIYVYTCPKCQHQFQISIGKDITSYNAQIGGKVLVCPKCGVKEVMKAKPKDDK